MGIGLSLLTMYDLARAAVPTFTDAVTGRVTRERCDDRLHEFARRVVGRTRMRLEIVGRERVPTDRAFVYMSNHQSHLDIPVLYATVPTQTLRMVAKRELFQIPVWGQAIRAAGFIEVDRKNRTKAIASLDRAKEALESGISIWIAPEGTRSKTGELGPLKKGGFHLATNTDTPIVPVAISGTGAVLPPHGKSMAYDMPVRVTFGEPLELSGRSIPELRSEVAAFLESHIE